MSFARNGNVELFYEVFGNPTDPALLLINGNTSQCIFYPEAWCQLFVDAGLFVIRMDNRDVGLSTDCIGIEYTLSDMAADCVAVLDALNIAAAHIHGLSLGGLIAQTIAIEHRQRVLTLTSVMSSTGEDSFRRTAPEVMQVLLAPPPATPQDYIEQHIEGLRAYGSPQFADEERWRKDATEAAVRSFRPAGPGRQFDAAKRSASRVEALRQLTVPTLVLHGSHDTLIDPIAGRRTAELIPGATFVLIDGMGHDYPPQLWERWTGLVVGHIKAH